MNKQNYLILSIRFLANRYHGCAGNGGRPEWPPSPWRLFQALIAGNARGVDLPERLQTALRWLEELEPPMITVPPAQAGEPILTYVPNNTGDETWPPCKAPKTLRPTLLNGDRLVEFVWPFSTKASHCAMDSAGVVAEAVGHVQCLGWGVDMAIGHGTVTDSWSPPASESRVVYRPTKCGETTNGTVLRTPCRCSLKTLIESYRGFLARYDDPKVTRFESPALFGRTRYTAGDGSRPWVAFELRRENGDRFPVSIGQITRLTGQIRHVCAQAAGGKYAPGVGADILGHPEAGGGGSRVSIMVLPTVRNGPTDGGIRRIILAEPYRSEGRWIKIFRERLDKRMLEREAGDNHLPRFRLERICSYDSILHLYVTTAREWISVTPILLPGFDDPGKKFLHGAEKSSSRNAKRHTHRLSRAKQLIHKSLQHAGISADIQKLTLSKIPFMTGAKHVRDYHCSRKLQHYPRYFARIVFSTSLSGPLALGAGRHAGFGVLAAIE